MTNCEHWIELGNFNFKRNVDKLSAQKLPPTRRNDINELQEDGLSRLDDFCHKHWQICVFYTQFSIQMTTGCFSV